MEQYSRGVMRPAPAAGHPPLHDARQRGWPEWEGQAVIERRMVRRAEAMWLGIGGDTQPDALPDGREARAFLRPQFGANALLCEAADGEAPMIVEAGPALLSLADFQPGPLLASAGQPGRTAERASGSAMHQPGGCLHIGRVLAELGERTMRLGQRCRFDADTAQLPLGAHGPLRPPMLVRAIGLPFERTLSGRPGRSAVVVASWRKLLSTEETRALHAELAAALDWIKLQTP